MLTFGLVVEGDYDEAVLTEFIRKCAGHDVEIVSRVCNPKGSLMKRFPGFLEEFRYVKQGMPVDRAMVIRDADMREPHRIIARDGVQNCSPHIRIFSCEICRHCSRT